MGSLHTPLIMITTPGLCLCLLLAGVSAQEVDPAEALAEVIPGEPGEDYPIFAFPPDTSFVCDGQPAPGYYSDPEADCQSFHICINAEIAAEQAANSPDGDATALPTSYLPSYPDTPPTQGS